MTISHIAAGTDENGNLWVYHFINRDDVLEFVARANRCESIDMHFEYVPIDCTMTPSQALEDLISMKT